MQNNKRRLINFLINPKFQIKFIFWISSTGLALIFSLCLVFYIFINENYMLIIDLADLTPQAVNRLYYELKQIIIIISAICFFFVVIVSFCGIIISHRVVGPLHKMKTAFKDVKDGNMKTRVFFRPKDNFQDMANLFNEMMDSLDLDNDNKQPKKFK